MTNHITHTMKAHLQKNNAVYVNATFLLHHIHCISTIYAQLLLLIANAMRLEPMQCQCILKKLPLK